MANQVFNIALGKIAQLVQNVEDNSPAGAELVVLLFSVAEADDVLNNHDTIAALVAGTNTECAFTNYVRKDVVAAGITVTIDDTANTLTLAFATNITWPAATDDAPDPVKLVIAYDPTGASANTALIPLAHHDWAPVLNGNDLVMTAGNFAVINNT